MAISFCTQALVLTEEEIREVFKTFDHDSSGTMSASELNDALQLLCIDLTDEERHDPKYNLDGDSETLNEEEFVTFVKDKFEGIDFMGRASDSLGQFDEQGSGTLSRETMMVILTQRGSEPFSEEEANAILDEFDINNDGRFDIVGYGHQSKSKLLEQFAHNYSSEEGNAKHSFDNKSS